MLKKLAPTELFEACDKHSFSFNTTEELSPLTDIIGQERAVRAMEFGLKINHKGYNIFMTGLTGTGKTSYARSVVERVSKNHKPAEDIIYVYNFSEPEKPLAILLPPGKGIEFYRDMENLLSEVREEVSRIFNDEHYENLKQTVLEKYQKQSIELFSKLDDTAKTEGFTIQKTSQGIVSIPLNEAKPMNQEDYEALPEQEKKLLEQKNQVLQAKIDEVIRKVRGLDKKAREELSGLEKNVVLRATDPLFEDITARYKAFEEIKSYIKAVKEDFIENLVAIRDERRDNSEGEVSQLLGTSIKEELLVRYKVNLFVDNKDLQGAPVVFETNPTYYNLFGKIEGKAQLGTVVTDFTMIKSGAIHRARGGYLILHAQDLFKDPLAWDTLKRTIINIESRIENIGHEYRSVPTITLRPEPIPINVKVILIGTPYIYGLLNAYDEDFKKLFKIKVDFDVDMKRNPENIGKFAAFIADICREQGLLHFTPCGVARVIDYSSRLAEDKHKLSTRFNEILEVLYESSTWAQIDGKDSVDKEHVEKAVSEKTYRSNKIEERLLSKIEKGEILISTQGKVVGQVNGLSVLDVGDYIFGQPSRITSRSYIGDSGVINIEREVKMSGHIHNKAVMILEGYLGEKYAKDIPLNLSASITFEQSYGGIEGDSATCAELLALLSSISGIPVRQDIAITGSADQHGNVQPVGGTTYKIEGFYHTCKLKGITGTQGVIIPHQNTESLMLKPEVIWTVRQDKFHIYAANTIDEIIEIMTGIEPDEFHKRVKAVLKEMAQIETQYKKED